MWRPGFVQLLGLELWEPAWRRHNHRSVGTADFRCDFGHGSSCVWVPVYLCSHFCWWRSVCFVVLVSSRCCGTSAADTRWRCCCFCMGVAGAQTTTGSSTTSRSTPPSSNILTNAQAVAAGYFADNTCIITTSGACARICLDYPYHLPCKRGC